VGWAVTFHALRGPVFRTEDDMDEIAALKQIPLFANMDNQELAGLRAAMGSQLFAPGQTIIHEGEEGQYFYVILQGTVQYLINDASGTELLLDEASAGAFFGELSMLTGEKRLIRVRAKDEVVTLSLERPQFHEFLLKHPHAAIDVLTALSHRLYTTDKLLRQSVSRNVNEVMEEKQTFGERVADAFASLMGSWTFIIVQTAILAFWVIFNVLQATHVIHWDEYPFIFLNLALSFQAAYSAPIIMMSQNRAAQKDRLSADIDHEVNVKAETKIGLIMNRLDDIERGMHFLHAEQLKHFRTHAAGNGASVAEERT
jgi:uncharacterized membrane protein